MQPVHNSGRTDQQAAPKRKRKRTGQKKQVSLELQPQAFSGDKQPARRSIDHSMESSLSNRGMVQNQKLIPPKGKSQKNGGSFKQFVKGQLTSTAEFIKSKDLYGQPVSLNYQGEDTYKTCPGGCLSISVLIILFCYAVLKFKYMMLKEEWQLIQQTVVADLQDLERPFDMSHKANENITMAIQFYLKKPKQTVADQLSALSNRQSMTGPGSPGGPGGGPSGPGGSGGPSPGGSGGPGGGGPGGGGPGGGGPGGPRRQLKESYHQRVNNIATYLQVVSMIEKKSGSTYTTYKDINPDLYTWIEQDNRTLTETNEAGQRMLIEMPFDLANATIQGTENHLENMDVVTSRYQIRFNRDLMQINAFKQCKQNSTCAQHFTTSKPKMLNNVFSVVFDNYENQTVDERVSSTDSFTYMQKLAVSEDEMDEFTFYKSYYTVFVPLLETKVTNDRNEILDELMKKMNAQNTPAGGSSSGGSSSGGSSSGSSTGGTSSGGTSSGGTSSGGGTSGGTSSGGTSSGGTSSGGTSSGGTTSGGTSGGGTSSGGSSSSGGSTSGGTSGGTSGDSTSGGTSGGSTSGGTSSGGSTSGGSTSGGSGSGGGSPPARLLQEISSSEDKHLASSNVSHQRRRLTPYDTYLENQDKAKSIDYSATLDIDQLSQDLEAYKAQKDQFTAFLEEFENDLNGDLESIQMQLVVYDEIEFFRAFNDDQFDYPYQKRKNKISQSTFTTSTDDDGDYQYPVQSIFLQQSISCLEASVFEQMNFVTELFQSVPALFRQDEEEVEQEKSATLEERCDFNTGFEKIKYVDSRASYKNYLDDYEEGVIPNKILLEISLEMDAFMTMSLRTSTQILDFLGDLGGFYQALDLIIFMAAEYFSARFFLASIASTLYLLKDSKQTQDIKQKLQADFKKRMNSLGGKPNKGFAETPSEDAKPSRSTSCDQVLETASARFKEIKVRSLDIIVDPLIIYLLTPCKRCCLQRPVFRRQKMLEQCEEKFTEELEITNLLSKIRDTHDMTRHLKDEAMGGILKYSRTRVIQLEEVNSDDENSEEEEKEPSQNVTTLPHRYQQYVTRDIQKAIGYSIIEGASLSDDAKEKLLESTQPAEYSTKKTVQGSIVLSSLDEGTETPLSQFSSIVMNNACSQDKGSKPSQFLRIEEEKDSGTHRKRSKTRSKKISSSRLSSKSSFVENPKSHRDEGERRHHRSKSRKHASSRRGSTGNDTERNTSEVFNNLAPENEEEVVVKSSFAHKAEGDNQGRYKDHESLAIFDSADIPSANAMNKPPLTPPLMDSESPGLATNTEAVGQDEQVATSEPLMEPKQRKRKKKRKASITKTSEKLLMDLQPQQLDDDED